MTFTLTHDTEDLTLALLQGQLIGVRATSVGTAGGSRDGSSKLISIVPEPSTAILVGVGLAALATRRNRRVAAQRHG